MIDLIFIMFLITLESVIDAGFRTGKPTIAENLLLNFDEPRKSLRCVEALNEHCNILAKTTKTGHMMGDMRYCTIPLVPLASLRR